MKISAALSALALPSLALAGVVEVPFARRSGSALGGASEAHDRLRSRGNSKRDLSNAHAIARRDIATAQRRYFPDSGGSSPVKRSTGSAELFDVDGDMQFFATISVGTPAQPMNVIVDTGSADLVLASTSCTSCKAGTTLFSSSNSSTCTSSTSPFYAAYGGGSATGTIAMDKVSIGGLTVANQTFGACAEMESLLTETYESGLLGLGWKALAHSGATPLVQQLWEQGSLDEPVFGMAYASWIDNSSSYDTFERGGLISLGGVNAALYSGTVSYSPLTNAEYGFWSIALEDVLVNGVSLGINTDLAIVDSGSTLISMPSAAVSKVYAAVGDSKADDPIWSYPSSASVNFSLVLNGVAYSVPFEFGTDPDEPERAYGIVYDASKGSNNESVIIGDAFLRHVYSAFDFAAPAVGFAPLVDTNRELELGTQPTKVSGGVVPTTAVNAVSSYTPARTATGVASVATGKAKTSAGEGTIARMSLSLAITAAAAMALCGSI